MAAHLDVQCHAVLSNWGCERHRSTAVPTVRQSAVTHRNRVEKELIVYRHIQHWMPEVDLLLSTLSLSQKICNTWQKVDYYGAKLKRQTVGSQWLYLLCIFKRDGSKRWTYCRWCASCQTDQTEGKDYAQEAVFKDWQKAAKVAAAEVLHLFIDDSIDLLPFAQ